MIVANAAGNGGRAEMGEVTEVVENLPAPDVLPMMTTVTITNAAKISLCTYFTITNWSLNKSLPVGVAFWILHLGTLCRRFILYSLI
jgi:hypothetical protein